jgi:ATP-binding cassette subfamily F protein 3
MPDKLLLQVNEISKAFGDKIILNKASVSIVEKQKIGVIGRNGAGKTTFFKMILGQEEPDSGVITHMPDLRLGYIEQHDPFLPGETVLGFLERYTGKPEWECAKVASQFQLKGERLASLITGLSGGYQMRVKLTATLLFEPNLLLLDEPTNYLDLSTLILLEKFLLGFRGAVMVITHDREFLKKTCNATLDVDHGQLFYHPEGLEEYLEFKEEQKALAESVNLNIERKQKQLQTFVNRFGAKASMAASAQSKRKQIDRLDEKKIGIANPFSTVTMRIPPVEAKAGVGLECKDLTIGYPGKIVASDISFEVERGKKVAILGDNGQGKSTLLKTIAGELAPISGSCGWRANLKLSYYNQHVSLAMNPKHTVYEYVRGVAVGGTQEEDIYKMLGNFLFKKTDSTKQITVLSGGEKARLCLAGMFLTKADVYLLDEPTNHLDFETVEAMGEALGKFNGTVLVVSHNRTFVNLIATEIIEVKAGQVKRVNGTYEDYVWLMEEEAEKEQSSKFKVQSAEGTTASPLSINSDDVGVDPLSPNPPSKENARKLYDLRKELGKIENKIKKLQDLVEKGEDVITNQAIIDDQEIKWLEVQAQMEELK